MEEVSEGMQEFAAKTVEGGSTILHGAQVYQGVARNTGMNPAMTQSMNQSPFGIVAAAAKGVLPWQIASMSPNQTSANAMEAVQKLAEAAGNPGPGRGTTNIYGETEPGISAEAAKLAQMHLIDPEASTEYLKRMLELGKKLQPGYKGTEMQAIESGGHKATQLGQFMEQKEHENQAYGPNVHKADQAHYEWQREAQRQKQLEANLKGSKKGNEEEEENLETAKENAQEKYHAMQAAKQKASEAGKLNAQQEGNVIAQLPQLYQRAREAGLGQHGEIHQWMMEAPEKQVANINAALSKAAEVNPEKEEKAKAEIVMNPNTEKWFKLQFPNAKTPKQGANAGNKSIASYQGSPNNESPAALLASQVKAANEFTRHEPTTGG